MNKVSNSSTRASNADSIHISIASKFDQKIDSPTKVCTYKQDTYAEAHGKLLLPGTLKIGAVVIQQSLFVDSGADGNFIDSKFVHAHNIPLVPLSRPIKLHLADGTPSCSGLITEEIMPLQLHLGAHVETISFHSNYCLTHCVSTCMTLIGFPISAISINLAQPVEPIRNIAMVDSRQFIEDTLTE